MARITDELLDHEVDGIQEYDNPLPGWWLGIFYVTIAFTVFLIPYLPLVGWTSAGQLEDEMEAADAKYGAAIAQLEEQIASAGPTDADVAAGKEIYATYCVACHAADGTGGIGPNLTDAEWIHGGELAAIRKTVTVGVPEKGMVAWGDTLGAEKVAQVSAYVHSLGGGK